MGVARDVPPALAINDLPAVIDVCLISHDHYDHLDLDSVLALLPRVQMWVVPLGIKEWLQTKGNVSVDSIIELEWWESVKLKRRNDTKNNSWKAIARHSAIRDLVQTHPALADDDVVIANRHDNDYDDKNKTCTVDSMWLTCCPAQHWSSRTFFDRNFRLWSSFAVFLPGSKFYFGGDTALPDHFPLFDQIRDYVGGDIDLAALPIGAYEPAFYMADSHMNPTEAVRVHQALEAKLSVGIHWGTFALSEEPMDEPPLKLQEAVAAAAAAARTTPQDTRVNFTTVRHGESITVDCRVAERESTDSPDDDEVRSTPGALFRR